MRNGYLTNQDVARMREMIARGRKVSRIAMEIGCSPASVYRHARDEMRAVKARPSPVELADRARMIIETYDATPRGQRLALAKPLGFANALTLRVRVFQIRRQMRAAQAQAA